ncbi:hypothetical protein CSKR_106687 [Clonorchis sinensis]|uniref:Uncharacterized protein n=2 Tax=Clonorchis sinensis TaxID=79923 RepID=H2KPH5_CLOSI|nr:hypothetical protein CSKR_106687 [Clonorchis sinensis]GAA43107.2 hypothetical protein CLF_101998 [Clonorchis sinensis]
MSGFVERVSQYQVVEEGCKAASAAYQNIKSNEHLGTIFAKVESAATSLAAIMKPVLDSQIAHKLDEVASRQILDRVESLCPTLKDTSTEQLLGPVANRALTLAETCADYCLPEDQIPHQAGVELTRTERLSRIQTRAKNQALHMFHASVGRAHELLSGLAISGSELSQKLPTATIASTLSQVMSVLTFACDTAKSVSFPIILHGLDTIREQTNKLDKQLKEKGTLNWLDLQNVLQGLDKLRTYLEEQPKIEQLELQEIPSHSTGIPCTGASNETNGTQSH